MAETLKYKYMGERGRKSGKLRYMKTNQSAGIISFSDYEGKVSCKKLL